MGKEKRQEGEGRGELHKSGALAATYGSMSPPHLCKVHDVDVVADGSPVNGAIVAAKHSKRFAAACDDLLDVRQEVIGGGSLVHRGLPKGSAWVVGDGVEVSQEDN